MKRRTFILGSVIGLLGIGVFPFVQGVRSLSGKNKSLTQPKLLSLFCDRRTIRMLGQAYIKLKPLELRFHSLNDLLRDAVDKTVLESQDMVAVETQIEKRIKRDFDQRNTVVLKGWVLSVTEARQCAYFSILNT
jgi:hypothetical protein